MEIQTRPFFNISVHTIVETYFNTKIQITTDTKAVRLSTLQEQIPMKANKAIL